MHPLQLTALVTGAGRGSGRSIALALGQAGARILALDINPDSVQRTVDEITAGGGQATAHTVDVSNKLALQTLHYTLLETGEPIRLVVNGAWVTPAAPALKLDEWEWNRTVDVNLKGVFLVSQIMARAMVAGESRVGGWAGMILNVVRPASASPHAAVQAARAGVLGLTAALAQDWEPLHVRVDYVETRMPEAVGDEVVLRCRQLWP